MKVKAAGAELESREKKKHARHRRYWLDDTVKTVVQKTISDAIIISLTMTLALLKKLAQDCDVGPPFQCRDQKYHLRWDGARRC